MRINSPINKFTIFALLTLLGLLVAGCTNAAAPESVTGADASAPSDLGISSDGAGQNGLGDTLAQPSIGQLDGNTPLALQDIIEIAVETALAAQALPAPTPAPALLITADVEALLTKAVRAALAARAAPAPTPIPALEFRDFVGGTVEAVLRANRGQLASNSRQREFPGSGQAGAKTEFVSKWGTRYENRVVRPIGIAIGLSGVVYVTDELNHRIHVFSPAGEHVNTWGTQGPGEGQFSWPSGVAVRSSGLVYVTELGNHRVQVLDLAGRPVTQWGTAGRGDGQFMAPSGVSVGPSGRIYVTDAFMNRVQVFTSDGKFLAKWGGPGSGPGKFDTPIAIAVSPSGTVYVADHGNDRMQSFSSDGEFLLAWDNQGSVQGRISSPFGVAVDRQGLVYVTEARGGDNGSGGRDESNHRVQAFSATGQFLTDWGSLGFEDGLFNSPFGIAVGSTGKIYVADHVNGRVQVFK